SDRDAQVFKKYSQMKLQIKREALEKLNRRASEVPPRVVNLLAQSRYSERIWHGFGRVEAGNHESKWSRSWKVL
ncbi:MAG: hypothetical protein WA474_10440, partial [Candidatus Sulfotelmatobacter sp.]